jgi:hypothetical protein
VRRNLSCNRTVFPRIPTGLKPPDVRGAEYFRPVNRTKMFPVKHLGTIVREYRTVKTAPDARRADVTGLGQREPHVEGLALPKSVESGNLSFSKAGIRWMSVQAGRSIGSCQ